MRVFKRLFVVLAMLVPFASNADAGPATCSESSANPVLDAIDCNADPCVDFYQYACGNWQKKNPLPGDRPRFGRFDQLQERNLEILKSVLEKASVADSKRNANDQRIGDLYASCMDEAKINKLGIAPIQADLNKVAALKDKAELGALIATLHDQNVGVFFNFNSQQDLKDATRFIATVDQGGMMLPSRDYYFETDAKSKTIREKYSKHIEKMFVLAGVPAKKAAGQAKAVLEFETSLAKNALRPVDRREPSRLYHMMSVADLQKLAPFMTWKTYMQSVGTPAVTNINVAVVEFMKGLQETIQRTSLDDLKSYVSWVILRDSAPWLSDKFAQENFDFFNRTLVGQKEMRPRSWRCTLLADRSLGEALGQAFVDKAFAGDSKERVLTLISNLEKSLEKDIDTDLPWMTAPTKKEAKIKLKAIAKKIGYPDTWRDYSSVKIARDDLIGNARRAGSFEARRQLGKIGKPVDKKEWQMTPPTVNAYYDAQYNDINFPAGILQPPFYDKNIDDAFNYGAIGMVIGHEITHGFDDQGRQFDAQGNLRDWWTPADNAAFNERAKCFVDQYSSYVVVKDPKNGDVKQDGKLTLGEDAADNGGMHIAWAALMEFANGKKLPVIDGFTAAQRFFLGFAQVWCMNQSDEFAAAMAKTNPHSAGRFRTNGTVSNMPEFQKAFNCKTGQPMAPEKRCRIW